MIPPKEDSRNVIPTVVGEFERLGLDVTLVDPEKPMIGAQGTGFLISASGHVVTAAHVLGDEKEATVWLGSKRYEADVVSKDGELDLAVIGKRSTNTVLINTSVGL